MSEITKTSIMKIAKLEECKSVSHDCIPVIRSLLETHMKKILEKALVMNSLQKSKTLRADDLVIDNF